MTEEIFARDFRGGRGWKIGIQEAAVSEVQPVADNEVPETDLCIGPGLFDLQVNGIQGVDFSNPDLTWNEISAACEALLRNGVTEFLPTVTTHSNASLLAALGNLAVICRQDERARCMVRGFHLEGPYISPADGPRGAHPREHCRPPDWQEFQAFQEAAGQQIRVITLSPEYDEAADFIRQAVQNGVVVAIGHTNANTEQIHAAVEAGATLSTHLGNGAHGMMRRHPNYIWDQLAEDRLTTSLIADGFHLPPNVLKSFWRVKGPGRTILVSDLTVLSGQPPGAYHTPLGNVEVLEDGRLVVAGQRQYLAGATVPLVQCMRRFHETTDATLAESWNAASNVPTQLIEHTSNVASWDPRVDNSWALVRIPAFEVAGVALNGVLTRT